MHGIFYTSSCSRKGCVRNCLKLQNSQCQFQNKNDKNSFCYNSKENCNFKVKSQRFPMLFGFSILLKSVWNWDYSQRISGTIFVKEYMEEEFLLLSDITTMTSKSSTNTDLHISKFWDFLQVLKISTSTRWAPFCPSLAAVKNGQNLEEGSY